MADKDKAIIHFEVDPGGKLKKKFKRALEEIDDLRIPLSLIRESWFAGNGSIFAISGPGKWADLTPGYKKAKKRDKGFIYPILFRDGTLKSALTRPGDVNSISKLTGKKTLDLGVVDNVIFNSLNNGTRTGMKKRPFILLGVEQTAPSALNTRVQLWTRLLQDYIEQKTGESFRG